MFISFVKGIERKTGKLKTLAEVASPTYDQNKLIKLIATADAFDAPSKEGAELRATYSHMMCVVTNNVRNNREYADANADAVRARREASDEADRLARDKANAALESARNTLAQAKADLLAAGGTVEEDEELKAVITKLEVERDELLKKLDEAATKADTKPAESTQEESGDPAAQSSGGPTPPPEE